jgi:protein-S-isoprenylcysteine O-methyltransferase Ste14
LFLFLTASLCGIESSKKKRAFLEGQPAMQNVIGELDRLGVQLKQYGIDATSYDGDDASEDDGATLLTALQLMVEEEDSHVPKDKLLLWISQLAAHVKLPNEAETFVPKPHPLPMLVGSLLLGTGADVLSNIGLLIPLPVLFVPPVAGVVLVGSGIWIISRARKLMKEAGTSPEFSKGVRALVTTGPYQWTRNPMYLGSVLIGSGIALAAGSCYPFISVGLWAWWVNSHVVPGEEKLLQKLYGKQYVQYCETVPRWFSWSNSMQSQGKTKD